MKLFKRPKKSLGQNFLIDQNIIKKIIKIENIRKNSIILEIGAGYGNLTKKIWEAKPRKIFAVEKDADLAQNLKNDLKNFENIKIINDDIFNIIKKKKLGNNIIVFGNLTYNISKQILANLILEGNMNNNAGDVNNDGEQNILDIVILINIILDN